MSETTYRTPFVLGKPIKNPADFYGRQAVLRQLYDAALNKETVAVVGEPRCGNTSILYQLLHEEQRARYLKPEQDRGLLFAFVSGQLGAEGADSLLRRIALSVRRADTDAIIDVGFEVTTEWFEHYLEDLTDRGRRLVLLLDEVEVLAHIERRFWGWLETLVSEYDISVIASAHVDPSQYRSEQGEGPPFFNLFRSIYVGSFSEATFDLFLKEKSEITDFDYKAVRDVILDLAGRYPFYTQVAAALFYLFAAGASKVTDAELAEIRREFAVRNAALFEDAWNRLPPDEREALTWMALGAQPAVGDDHADALRTLERRGYVVDGRIFSSAFGDYLRERLNRIELSPAGNRVRVGRRVIDLPDNELRLLRYMLAHDSQLLDDHDLIEGVWPDRLDDSPSASAAFVADTVNSLEAALASTSANIQHIERVAGQGFRFRNAAIRT